MTYRKLDDNGDYTFGGNLNSFYIDDPLGVAQAVVTRLKLWENEWFLDIQEGTPYLGGVIGKYTMETFDPLIRDRILNTEGVTEILEYSSSYDGDLRKVSISVKINTSYGVTQITGAF